MGLDFSCPEDTKLGVEHSHWVLKQKGQKGYCDCFNAPCYRELFSNRSGLEALTIFHPQTKDPELDILWNQTVCRSALFKPVFKNRRPENNANRGFQVNVDQPANYVIFALISLRAYYEIPDVREGFNKLIGLGCNPEIAMYLAQTSTFGGRCIYLNVGQRHGQGFTGWLNPEYLFKFDGPTQPSESMDRPYQKSPLKLRGNLDKYYNTLVSCSVVSLQEKSTDFLDDLRKKFSFWVKDPFYGGAKKIPGDSDTVKKIIEYMEKKYVK